MKTPVTVDIEGDENQLLCVGYQVWGDAEASVVRVPDEALLDMLADPDRPVAQWSKYDAKVLTTLGYTVAGPVWDGMVMAYLINENTPLGLEWCAKRYLHHQMDKRIRSSSGQPVFKTDEGREVPLYEAPLDEVMLYCGRDVTTETQLIQYLQRRMQETAWWDYYISEHLDFTRLLMEMELRGLPVDLVESEKLREELELESARLHGELLADLDLPDSFNVNSGPQLAQLLFSKVFELTDSLNVGSDAVECVKSCVNGEHEDCDTLDDRLAEEPERLLMGYGELHMVDLLPRRFSLDHCGRLKLDGRWTLKGLGIRPGIPTPSGDRPSSSSPALLTNFDAASNPWVQKLLRYRKMTKVLTTYLRKFPKVAVEGRVHGRFNQTGTVTGRLSSSDPNLQNIPAHGDLGPRVRRLFKAQEGTTLLVGDFSQLEPRLMAHFSMDPVLLDVYRTGKDIYLTTAELIWGEVVEKEDPRRGIAKTYVLAMGYGAGIKKLQQILTINGYPIPLGDVEWQFGRLQEGYSRFFRWRNATISEAKRKGYVTTLSGQHRRLAAQFKSQTWKARGYGERQAVNARIQGSAGDIMRRGMLKLGREMPEVRQLAQVHDEVVGEVDLPVTVDLDRVSRIFAEGHGFDLNVPLVFEPHLGQTWYDAKEGTTFVLPEDYASPFEDEDAEIEEAS